MLELGSRGAAAAEALQEVPEAALLELAERLAASGEAAAGARALIAAALSQEAARDEVAAAKRYVRAMGMDRSNQQAENGVLRTAPALAGRCATLEQRCASLEQRCRELEEVTGQRAEVSVAFVEGGDGDAQAPTAATAVQAPPARAPRGPVTRSRQHNPV